MMWNFFLYSSHFYLNTDYNICILNILIIFSVHHHWLFILQSLKNWLHFQKLWKSSFLKFHQTQKSLFCFLGRKKLLTQNIIKFFMSNFLHQRFINILKPSDPKQRRTKKCFYIHNKVILLGQNQLLFNILIA